MSLTVRFPRPSAVATRPAGSCVDTTAPARRSWSKNSFKRTTNWRPRRSTAFPWAICEATCISRASGQLRWSSQTTSSAREVQSHVKQAVSDRDVRREPVPLDTPPLKLLDAVKHSVEDKRFFLSEQLLNVGNKTQIEEYSVKNNIVFFL